MEDAQPRKNPETSGPTDLQRLGNIAACHEVVFSAELSDPLRTAYELFMEGSDHEAVRDALGLESAEHAASLESDLVARAFRRLTRISHTSTGLAQKLHAWATDHEARKRAEESQAKEQSALSSDNENNVDSTVSKTIAQTPPRRSRKRKPRQSVKKEQPPKVLKPRSVRKKQPEPPKPAKPTPVDERETLRLMSRLLTDRGKDPVVLLQDNWSLQRAFWLLTTTDASIRHIRSLASRRQLPRLPELAKNIEDMLYEAAPDIVGFAPEGAAAHPRPLDDEWWLRGERREFIQHLAKLAAARHVDLRQSLKEAPRLQHTFLLLAGPTETDAATSQRLGIQPTSLPKLAKRIIEKLVDNIPELGQEFQALRSEVRAMLARKPLPRDRTVADGETLPVASRQTILQMHRIAAAHALDPYDALSDNAQGRAIYPMLIDPNQESSAIMAFAGLSEAQLAEIEMSVIFRMSQAFPQVFGFPRRTLPGEETLQQSLEKQDWRLDERRNCIIAISKALAANNISAGGYLSGFALEAFEALANPAADTKTVLGYRYNLTFFATRVIEDLIERVPPGVLEIPALRAEAMRMREHRKAIPRASDEGLLSDGTAGDIARLLMKQRSCNLNTLTKLLAKELGRSPSALRKFFQGQVMPGPRNTLIPVLGAAGVEGETYQQYLAAYQAERRQFDGRSANAALKPDTEILSESSKWNRGELQEVLRGIDTILKTHGIDPASYFAFRPAWQSAYQALVASGLTRTELQERLGVRTSGEVSQLGRRILDHLFASAPGGLIDLKELRDITAQGKSVALALASSTGTKQTAAPELSHIANWQRGEMRLVIQKIEALELANGLRPSDLLSHRPGLKRAYLLLIRPELSTTHIRDQLGFNHLSHLSRLSSRIIDELATRIPAEMLELDRLRAEAQAELGRTNVSG